MVSMNLDRDAGPLLASAIAYTEGTITPAGTLFSPLSPIIPYGDVDAGPDRDGSGPSAFRWASIPVLGIDTSGGPCDGRRYVVWADQPGPLDSDADVLLSYSDDGESWSPPAVVHDVERGDQMMPWLDVDSSGGIHLAWYDRRHDDDNRLLDVYYRHGAPCGETWYPDFRITETSFDGDLGHHQNGGPFIGSMLKVWTSGVRAPSR